MAWNPMEAYTFTVANEDYKSENILIFCSLLDFLFTEIVKLRYQC